jgi:dienelactone hydrolase
MVSVGLAGCIGGEEPSPAAGPNETETNITTAAVDHSRPASAEQPTLVSALAPTTEDPTAPGELSTEKQRYDFGWTIVNASHDGPAYNAKLNGSVTYPSDADTPSPVVAIIHGQHQTCNRVAASGAWPIPCPEAPPVSERVPNADGYDYIAETLASHGYVVVSIDGNTINDKNLVLVGLGDERPVVGDQIGDAGVQARAQLVLRTLDGFSSINEGDDPSMPPEDNEELVAALEDSLDMSTIGLVGHSRGGDGVSYAVTYNQDRTQGSPHAIEAVFAIGPTDFTSARVPGVAYATLLPICDGDVTSLDGAQIYDRSRYLDEAGPLYQFVAMGANHNFYNTIWDRDGDDASDADEAFCGTFRKEGGGRLNGDDQRRHGEALINAFLRTHLGEEAGFETWLEGRALPPQDACPAGESPCPGLIHTSYHPREDERLVIESVADGQATDENDLGVAIETTGSVEASVCEADACPSQPNRQLAAQLTLTWDGPGAYTLEIPDEQADISSYGWLSLRTGVNFDADENEGMDRQAVTLTLADTGGSTASVSSRPYGDALYTPPGPADTGSSRDTDQAEVTLSAIRVPLDAFTGVDLTQLSSLAIVTDQTPKGSIQVVDVMLQR